jgi:hypothetical protein
VIVWIETDEWSARWGDVPEADADWLFNLAEIALGPADTIAT